MPIERAEPMMIFIAASMSWAFKSGIFASAISRTWLWVTLPTLSLFGAAEPFFTLAALRRKKLAGGVLVTKEKDRSVYAVISTGDAVLVADRDQAQDVKHVVNELTNLEDEAATFHQTVHRPWGSYTILEDADDCKVKRLVVKPGQVLSLQLHHRRSEHWTVVRGTAKVRLGDEEFLLEENQSTYIPTETLHRLENPGSEDVHLIEVQTGDYFGEDDIERFEDIYGRVK